MDSVMERAADIETSTASAPSTEDVPVSRTHGALLADHNTVSENGADRNCSVDTAGTVVEVFCDSTSADSGQNQMSKRQQKRLAKRRMYLEMRPQLRRAEKARRKEKRAAARQAAGGLPNPRRQVNRMPEGDCCVKVIIDLSFDQYMTDRDLGKCVKQVQRCYAANRRSPRPVQLYLTSLEGRVQQALDKQTGWTSWNVHIHQDHFLKVAEDRESITYLTSESDTELEALRPGQAYVIGGLVDHNHHRGLCRKLADEQQLKTARLPIQQHVKLSGRFVLTVDQVFSLLLLVSNGRSWRDALCTVLPPRKLIEPLPEQPVKTDSEPDQSSADLDETSVEPHDTGS